MEERIRELEAEVEKLRRENADAANLRRVFTTISAEYGTIYHPSSQMLPAHWQPSQEDLRVRELWKRLYEAVRDTRAGLAYIAEMAQLRAENASLRATQAFAATLPVTLPGVIESVGAGSSSPAL